MLVEIHMLQNHAPSNLNRDDTGSPKDCIFGGVKRARISSQCLKRSIRRSEVFRDLLKESKLAVRTRRLPELVRAKALEAGLGEEIADLAAKRATGFGNKDGTEQKSLRTAQTMFLSDADIEAVADVIIEAAKKAGTVKKFEEVKTKELQASEKLTTRRPLTPDLALFGRMITSDAFDDVDAAVQVAHAISANKIDHEFDYYTAVDDLQSGLDDDKGADMIGDIEFNSACFYKYFSIDIAGLFRNLSGGAANDDRAKLARELIPTIIDAFFRAAVFTTPSGKQNSFAAHQLPDAILIEVRPTRSPVSYANAFVKPVRPRGDSDLVDAAIEALKTHADQLKKKFSLKAEPRLWLTTRGQTPEGVVACETLNDLTSELRTAIAGGI